MEHSPEEIKQLSMFGVRQMPDGTWRPILQRVKTNQCTKCKGFGTYGIPMCGAVYLCDQCKGTGSQSKASLWKKVFNWFK